MITNFEEPNIEVTPHIDEQTVAEIEPTPTTSSDIQTESNVSPRPSRKRKATAPRVTSTKLKKKSKATVKANSSQPKTLSYDDLDNHVINLPLFNPSRTPGAYIKVPLARGSMTRVYY